MKPYRGAPAILAVALMLGGLREPLLFALGGGVIWLLVLRERPPLGPAKAWLPWLAWAALSAVLSAQPLASVPALARWSAALAFASLAASWDSAERRRWLEVLAVTAGVLAAAALWTGAGLRWSYGPSMTGLLPPYYNYTAFALAAAAAGGGAVALHDRATRRERLAGAATFALGTLCVLLARSRGACLGLAAAGTVWCVRRWGLRAAIAAAAVALVAVGVGRSALADKSGRPYPEVRLKIWRSAAETASDRPLFGEGPGSFTAGFRRHPFAVENGAARWGLYSDYAHSEPLQAAAETGWAGLALWLLGFGSLFAALARRSQSEPAREAAAAALAAMSAQLLVDNMLQLPGLAFLFFSTAAVAGPALSGGRRWPAGLAFAGCLLALTAWMPRALARGNPARAVSLFPADAELREDLAYRLMSEGRAAESDPVWSEASRLAPYNAIYPYQRARLAAARGAWSDAESFAARAAELEPGFLNARILRAEALWRLRRAAPARAELAAIAAERSARPQRSATAHYDEEIRGFDAAQFERVAALARGAR